MNEKAPLVVSTVVPSAGFWTRSHVGVRIDPGALGISGPVVVLTGAADSTPSRLLADTISHRFIGQMIDSPPWPGGFGRLVSVAFNDPVDADWLPVALIFLAVDTRDARAVADAITADRSLVAAVLEAGRRETMRQAPGALILAEENRLGRPLGHCMPPGWRLA